MDKSSAKLAEKEGRSLSEHLVNDIMPNIDHTDPLNCLLSSLSLVYHRILLENKSMLFQQVLKNDPMID
jgi:hypothetical protein